MERFDPYHRWLGIPPEEQPAHHYRLLGLVPFESDPEVIRDAAERQMGHVRRYGLGKHVELSQKVLNELGGAKACLLNASQKTQYDAQLRDRVAAQTAARMPPPVPVDVLKPAARWKHPLILGTLVGGLVLAILIGGRAFRRGAAPVQREQALKIEPLGKQTAEVGIPLRLQVRLSNSGAWADKVEYRFSETEPDGATIDDRTGEIQWTPKTPGTVSVAIVAVSHDGRQYDETAFMVEVRDAAAKLAPLPDQFIDELQELRLSVAGGTAQPGDRSRLYRLGAGAPRGAQLDSGSGVFTWTPGEDQGPGVYKIGILAEQTGQPAESINLTVHVREVNQAPTIEPIAAQHVEPGKELAFEIRAADADIPTNKLTFRISAGPSEATLTASSERTCRFQWTPPAEAAGRTHSVRVSVCDDSSTPGECAVNIPIQVSSPVTSTAPQPNALGTINDTAVAARLSEFQTIYATLQPAFADWLKAWKACCECQQKLVALQNENQYLNNESAQMQFNVRQWQARLPGAQQGGGTLAPLAAALQTSITRGQQAIATWETKMELNRNTAPTLTADLAEQSKLLEIAGKKIDEATPAWFALCDPFGRLSVASHQASVTQLGEWIAAEREFGLLYLARGFGTLRLGKLDMAVEDFTRFGELGQGGAAKVIAATAMGLAMLKKGDLRRARQQMTVGLRLGENLPITNMAAGYLALAEKKYPDSVKRFQNAVRLTESASPAARAEALQALALALAASSNSSLRDGPKAMTLAGKACELTAWKSWIAIDTLAAAHAEVGDFPNATRRQKQALELAPDDIRAEIQERLAAYEAKRPRRL